MNFFKKLGHNAGRIIKKDTRTVARVTAKAVPYLTAVGAGVASIFGGPELGAAVTAAGAGASRFIGTAAARSKGLHGRAARHAGVILEHKSLKSGLLGMGLGGGVGAVAEGGLSLSAGAGLLTQGAKLALGALQRPPAVELGIQPLDGSLALSMNPVGSNMSASMDYGSIFGAPPGVDDPRGQPYERPQSQDGGGLVLLLAALAAAA